MIELLIVRHAIALDRDRAIAEGVSDAERPLTGKGEKRMRRIASALAEQFPAPARLLSSPYWRTRQTTAILADCWPHSPIEICPELAPGGDPLALLQHCESIDGPLVLVGHEPDLSELIGLLLGGQTCSFVQLKKGGAACLSLSRPMRPGEATLHWLMTPKQLLAYTPV